MQNPHPTSRRARRAGPLKGRATIPGDKSISQRAIILGGLAEGETRISGLLESGDVQSTAGAVRALGASVTREGPGAWRVAGAPWMSPHQPLDFGNSGTGSRLVMGAVAGQGISATFIGDASLISRPMARVLDPLKAFGATYEGQGPKALMPVTVHGAKGTKAADVVVTTASAQVKSALLLAALGAEGVSHIRQATLTRDHSEKMLAGFGAKISVTPEGSGQVIAIEGPVKLKACAVEVPRDPSSAAFPLVAALIVPGSEIELPNIMLNPRRTGLIETLLEMGARIEIVNRRVTGGEEIGDLVVRHSQLRGIEVPASRAPSMIDEYPILSVAAAFATGTTALRGLEELRVKESDRLEAVARGLKLNGVPHTIESDDLLVQGMGQDGVPGGGMVPTHMDHRIAMSFLTMGMASQLPVTVDDVTMIATSFPEYEGLMRDLGAVLE
ncbi:MAG: 3-phosphoshikimate 1-carboxyvinyltransferase [Alphaproteobacteria bacterium]|nr:3-phosphoshikimate 1-carboxyvinyltransferase [Alphaproteobacteria bacterium]